MKSIIVSLTTALIVIMGIGLMGSGEESASKEEPSSSEAAPEAAKPKAGPEQYINPIPLPDYLELAGEEVPLHDWDVRERLDKEILSNTYWHSNTIRILKLANRYFPMIERILAEQGVHDDMKFVSLVESGLTNNSMSGAGAKGPWQFMTAAAKQFGLEVANSSNYNEVDERYNWEKSTEAAAKYLKNEYNSLNNWTLAAAAYNAGHGRIKGSLTKQLADNYYDLYLTTETARYVFRILAMKEIYNNQEKYGFFLDSSEKYHPIDTKNIEVTEIKDIPAYAKSLGISYKTFKLLNPWLRTTKLTKRRSGKKYLVKVPY